MRLRTGDHGLQEYAAIGPWTAIGESFEHGDIYTTRTSTSTMDWEYDSNCRETALSGRIGPPKRKQQLHGIYFQSPTATN